MIFLYAFLVGGAICAIGQLLILKTNLTPARILVCFVALGVILQGAMAYKYIYKFAGSGISVPITGFGATLTKGAMDAVKEQKCRITKKKSKKMTFPRTGIFFDFTQ
jgi:stage V sporulation protein AE